MLTVSAHFDALTSSERPYQHGPTEGLPPVRQFSFTASLSVLPGLKTGTVEAPIDRLSPVAGLRPVRAGRLLLPKVPR